MDPLHAVYLTVGLFVITFFNPGANLFVVVQTSLASGRRAGVLTGLGVARLAFSSPLRVERRESSLKTFPVLAKTDPLAEYLPPADGGGPKADDDFAGLY